LSRPTLGTGWIRALPSDDVEAGPDYEPPDDYMKGLAVRGRKTKSLGDDTADAPVDQAWWRGQASGDRRCR